MKKDLEKNSFRYLNYIKGAVLEILVTAALIFLFAGVMFLTEKGFRFASLFATLSVAIGSLFNAFYVAKKQGSKGFLSGLIVGIANFLIITIVSLIVDKGAVTSNTLFHFIIIMLSSLIGGVMGVNKGTNKKYI